MFSVPSSDPPSTPDRRSLRSIPSTTPAGPPPSSTRALPSFTPRGNPPPSSAFGSSAFGTGNAKAKPLFASRNNGANSISRGRQMPPSSPPVMDDADVLDEMAIAPVMEDDSMMIDDSIQQISPGFGYMKSITGSSRYDSPRGNKRSIRGEVLRPAQHIPRRIDGLDIQGYAKGIAASAPTPKLSDPDEVVLESELQTEPLLSAIAERARPEEVAVLTSDLLKTWKKHGALSQDEIENEDIGPLDAQSHLKKANIMASLLLSLNTPITYPDGQSKPLPRVLLDWLDANHCPNTSILTEVLEERSRGYYASPAFWDAIYICLNRGRFNDVINLLKNAKFEDNAEQDFDQQQVEGIQFSVRGAMQVLSQCPALAKPPNWDVKDSDWTLWRHQVERASDDLRDYAEEDSGTTGSMWGSTLGRSEVLSQSQRSRKVDVNIPFEIYEPLQDMYKQLRGNPEEILKSSFDWLEAAVTLTAWWDGAEVGHAKSSLAASRQSLSRRQQTREVDLNPLHAYRDQLFISLQLALKEEDVREGLDITNDLHLGLACVVTGNIEEAIEICKSWSMPIACSLAELATIGGWIAESGSRAGIQNFDKSDLMVLSYGQPEKQGSFKDKILEQYSALLAKRNVFATKDGELSMEGWELALRVLARLDDAEAAQMRVTELLDKIEIKDNERVDNVLMSCNDLGFGSHAMVIAERYADSLADSTTKYGDALQYYLRAHTFAKAKRVIDVLITSSLVQSTAYPPTKKLDPQMKRFIQNPKETLNSLAAVDLEAAQKLSAWLSGYATLRRFYTLRDAQDEDEDDAIERKREAAKALLVVITSAADPIRGGLLDPAAEVIVPLDTLLVLLGEALPFLRESGNFEASQLFALLRVIEDLTTVGPRIFQSCSTLLASSIENYFGKDVPSPRAMLRKEVSGMTGSSAFSMVGSSMLNSKDVDMDMMEGSHESEVMIAGEEKRGWDWRKGVKRTWTGEEVVRVLRVVLAERIGDVWSE